MSWKNPTQKEAEEMYSQAKAKYQNTAESYLRNKKLLDAYERERNSLAGKGQYAEDKKAGLQKKIDQIEAVISYLSPGGSLDELVYIANQAARSSEESLSGSLKCSGIQSPPVSKAFRCPSVYENVHSYNALEILRKEKSRMEQELTELMSKLASFTEEMEALRNKINSINSTQKDLSKIMNNCTYEMQHYKKYI